MAKATARIRQSGKRIQEKVLEEWVRSSENEEELMRNLEQVILRLGTNVEISRVHLESFLDTEYESGQFALTNALAVRDLPKVLSLLSQALEFEGETPLAFLGQLISFYSQLKIVRTLVERLPFEKKRFLKDRNGIYNFPVSFFAKYQSEARPGAEKELLSRHPYVLKVLFTAALAYEDSPLEDWLQELEKADEQLKSSSIDPKYRLENLLVRLMGQTEGLRRAD
jgi:DNA polymerase III delta subunit